ncbi:MAG TPA: DNA-3-methyladenine glycosylase 2 family protein [Longimicrobiales bacterium]|nr:DNA-3-methyladenine glycosylase 2 family protein [Longimicrobiales bacterium]
MSQPRLDSAAAAAALSSHPVLGPMVRFAGPPELPDPALDHFAMLLRSITFQQLAGKAAATIHGRVIQALGGAATPGAVLAAPEDALRGAGLSANKLAAIRDLAGKAADGAIGLDDIDDAGDEEVIVRLTRVRGIGVWTAQMFLMFQLQRPDVWPTGDLGVRTGWAKLHGDTEPPSAKELDLLGHGFRPWRTAVAWYCYRAVDVGVPE